MLTLYRIRKRTSLNLGLIAMAAGAMLRCSGEPEQLERHIYNVWTDQPGVAQSIRVPARASLLQKLTLVAQDLSQEVFQGRIIEVVSVRTEQGKIVATIDLQERPEFSAAWRAHADEQKSDKPVPVGYQESWRGGAFQGSTGGYATQYALVETFLQRNKPGEWVDGIRFLYEGQPMRDYDFDHIFLEDIVWREE